MNSLPLVHHRALREGRARAALALIEKAEWAPSRDEAQTIYPHEDPCDWRKPLSLGS
jgi:hypothetical protein